MHSQNQDQRKQRAHHPFANAFNAVLQTAAADKKAQQHGNGHPDDLLERVGQQVGGHAADGIGGQAGECTLDKPEEIGQHPAADGGVIHHQHAAANQAGPAVQVPLAAFGFQRTVGCARAAVARTANSQLHGKHRRAHQNQEQQVEQHKHAAAILARYGWEAPHIANADGAACADQQKANARSK